MPMPGDQLVDRYRILEPLGSGGMATVHRAHDDRLDRDVAIKVLLPNLAQDPVLAKRFEEEARSMAAVAHPGLVAVFDVDPGDPETGREPFVVMELCPGGSLADRLGPGRWMPPDELVPILVSVSDALAALHRAGLVHRDVKPSNILFATDRVKIGDFGLARVDAARAAGELTDPGTAVGTLGYLAPERMRGEPGSPAADVYALGTVAHLGLTGTMPRPGGSVRDAVAAASYRAPAVSTARPALGRAFDDILIQALAVDPTRRPDALEFGSGLASALGRWSRAGRPGEDAPDAGVVAAAGTVEEPAPSGPPVAPIEDEVAVARFSTASEPDATTATAVPLEVTAAIPVQPRPEPAQDLGEPSRPATERSARRAGTLIVGAAIAAVILAAVVSLPGILAGLGGSPLASAPVPGPSSSGLASSVPSPAAASASAPPSAAATPARDPALVALDGVDSAIAAAKGGPDGLKGKEANELESLAGRVRRDLAENDRGRALRDARALDKRIKDVSDKVRESAAQRLRTASARLIDALGG